MRRAFLFPRLTPPKPTPAQRIVAVDALRGIAIAAMVTYHFMWDLSFFGFIATDIAQSGWRFLAQATTASFLFLVGIGLWLAHGQGVRWTAFFKRLLTIGAAACLVSIGTWFALPQGFIYFGILHCVVLSSLLALPFLRAPFWMVALTAVLVLSVLLAVSNNVFDGPFLAWSGLGTSPRPTNDYVPIFPWFGFVLTGIAIAPSMVNGLKRESGLRFWETAASLKISKRFAMLFKMTLARAGRHSLAIYMIHQPILLGLFSAVTLIAPGLQGNGAFLEACISSCVSTGREAPFCEGGCSCVAREAKTEQLWRQVVANRLTSDERIKMSEIAKQCFR